jgi:phosphopantothenoylcysteine decarboxylase/phosphopantothenate--cysteine ligase
VRLAGRRILLGITGGIAAYKAPFLLRLLQEEGADLRVVRTRHAAEFVTDTTLSALCGHPVHSDLFTPSAEFEPVLHVGLAKWADLYLVAPATANWLGKIAAGIADDLTTTIYLSTPAPVLVAPAMEEEMLAAPRVEENLRRLQGDGVGFVDPESGHLASGASGRGRLAELPTIVEAVVERLAATARSEGPAGGPTGDLAGRTILVTAGPTVEDLDPVRFLSNRSTGRMGYAVARRARDRGARVCLVTGPTQLAPPLGVEVQSVRSAREMASAAKTAFEQADAAILAAAVADYRPASVATQKIKKSAGATAPMSLDLVENEDISAALGATKGRRVVVAFAMETEEGVARATAKRARKQADLIVLNDLNDPGAGFATTTNVVTLIDETDTPVALPIMSKEAVADRILDAVVERLDRPR